MTYQFLVFEGLSGNHGWRCISFGLHSLQTVIHQIIQLNSSANERFWDQVKQSILKSQTLIEITINCTTTIQYLSIPSQILNVNGVFPPTNITMFILSTDKGKHPSKRILIWLFIYICQYFNHKTSFHLKSIFNKCYFFFWRKPNRIQITGTSTAHIWLAAKM